MADGTNIGNAYLQIIPSAKGVQQATKAQLNSEMGEVGEAAGNTLSSKLKGVIAKAGIGLAIGDTIRKGLGEGAALEQSLGGMEALYGDAFNTIKEYGAQAWRTVGVSANEYYEGVASFTAALKQGVGGDMTKAAESANRAFIAMGDNANRFGTDMGSIQAAYQGFAKQNYTMLDNLKLGYGGTKTEMERLLADAEKFSGVEYNIDNLADVYDAITVIQQEMGITGITAEEQAERMKLANREAGASWTELGTTAAEGTTTLSGATASLKAAWSDLLGNMAIGESVTAPLQNLTSAIGSTLANLVPMVLNIATQLPGALFNLVSTLAPQLLESGAAFMQNIAQGVTEAVPTLINTALTALTDFSTNLRASFGTFVDAGLELIQNLVKGIVTAIPNIVSQAPTIIKNFAGMINDNAPKVIKAGGEIIKSLWQGIKSLFRSLKENWREILGAIIEVVRAINWINLGKSVITGVKNGFIALKDTLPGKLKEFAQTAKDWFTGIDWIGGGKAVITYVWNGLVSLATKIPGKLKEIATTAWDWFKGIDWLGLGKTVINFIWDGLVALVTKVPSKLKEIGDDALEKVKNIDWLGLGKSVINFIIDGIVNLSTAIPNKLKEIGQSAIDGFKGLLPWNKTGKDVVTEIDSGMESKEPTINRAGVDLGNQAVKGWQTPDYTGLGRDAGQSIDAGMESTEPTAYDGGQGLGSSAKRGFGSVSFYGLGSSIISGVNKGIDDNEYILRNRMIDVALLALQTANAALGVNSPSKVFREITGRSIPEGIAAGVDKYDYYVTDAMDDLTSELAEPIIPNNTLLSSNGKLQAAIDNGTATPNYYVVVNSEIDGTPLKTKISDYTINKISNQQIMQLRAQGV